MINFPKYLNLQTLKYLTNILMILRQVWDDTADLKKRLNSVILQNIVKRYSAHLFSGDFEKNINTVAVASGSCSEIIPLAYEKGADVIITGDMKYHNMIDMTELGICVIDAGHYPTEICVMDIFEDILKDTDIEIIKSENKDIFKLV